MKDRTSTPQSDPSLDQVQRWLQTVIMDPEGIEAGIASQEAHDQIPVAPGHVDEIILRSHNQTSIERLQVYSNAYYARLLECLRDEFPALLHALGDETFDAFAFGYLQAYPSRSYTLANLGNHFPQFLNETRPDDDNVLSPEASAWSDFLIDLATAERTYSEVFSSPGFENQCILQPEDVEAISPEQIPDAYLVPVPCLRLLKLQHPVHEYISAVRHKKEIILPTANPTYLAITRRDYVVRRCSVSVIEYVILSCLQSGQSIGQSIEQASTHSGFSLLELELHLSDWFQQWAISGYFLAIRCSDTLNNQ